MRIDNLKYLIVVFITCLVASCDKEKDLGTPAEEAVVISSIIVAETPYNADATTIYLLRNQELQLDAAISPAIEEITFPEVTWTSSNESVVKVSETGKLSAASTGTAIVRVTHLSRYCFLSLFTVPVQLLSALHPRLVLGQQQQLPRLLL